jgi:17beta-estradiol 17-dehydrogenase / very-long-chain 3-oxoacyl-CoA reductase
VVTGCTEGIGRSFVLEFARRGFNIVLISRNREKLESVARQVASINAKVLTHIIVADFTKSYESDFYERIDQQLKDLDVSVLVNNVGLWYSGCFEEITAE